MQIPEDDIHYNVALTEVSGDGQLASSSTQAVLTVRHNDDPINFRNSALESSEGETVELVVTRGGHANGKHLKDVRKYVNIYLGPQIDYLLCYHISTFLLCSNRCCRSFVPSDLHICFI